MKVLVDTCVWIDFLGRGDPLLADCLIEDMVACHPIVIGELATGNLPKRAETLEDLLVLTRVPEASFEEVFHLVEKRHLYGRGLHWNDCGLLASALISGLPLWTNDRRLAAAARQCGCAWDG